MCLAQLWQMIELVVNQPVHILVLKQCVQPICGNCNVQAHAWVDGEQCVQPSVAAAMSKCILGLLVKQAACSVYCGSCSGLVYAWFGGEAACLTYCGSCKVPKKARQSTWMV